MLDYLLTILILLPTVGAVALIGHGFAWKKAEGHYRWISLGFSLLTFALSLLLLTRQGGAGFVFEQNVPWIGLIKSNYHIGVDGISLWLVILTTLLVPISILSSWNAVGKKPMAFFVFMLLLESAMVGVFVSLDLVLFYLFFEASLVPMFFLIGIWGGERRIYAATKFFIYTAVGSLLMLVGIITLYLYFGSFDYVAILNAMRSGNLPAGYTSTVELLLFAAFAIAFFIKVPIFPLHTWLPDAHTEAPTAGSVILAGILLKMGTYGLMRFNLPLFPEASRASAWFIIVLAVIGIIYGALVAMVQPDVKRLVAYSSVSHMGFVVLGLFSFTEQGLQGALYQMLNHGVSTGALFLLVGMIYERRHTRQISDFGGLATSMPIFSTIMVIATLSSIGLPLLNGFVGEFLILIGTWLSTAVSRPWLTTMLAATGVIWAAVYMLWMVQRVVFGKLRNPANARLSDLSAREIGLMIPLLVLMLFMGAYPGLFLRRSSESVAVVQQRVNQRQAGGAFAEVATPVEPRK